jgi:ABC-type polysaccharide/polyol phosphate export permease
LIGFIAFTWTIRTMLEARRFVELRDRMAEASRHPVAFATAACLAPPTFAFLISLAVAAALAVAVLGSTARLSEVAWLAPTVLVHLIGNTVLLLALGAALARRWIADVAPAVIAVALVWMISPVMYRFEDIPEPANALLTTLNPASHILAAYHNALWRNEPISLRVLPAAGVIGIVAIAWLARRAERRLQPGAAGSPRPDTRAGPHLIAALDGAPPALGSVRVFSRWRGEIGGLTGEDMVALIAAARGQDAARAVAAIGAASEIGRLYRDSLAIYPPWALAQLAFAVAMASGETGLVLDGVLDEARPSYLAQAWTRLEKEAALGRRITVVTYIAMSLPWTAKGTFQAVGMGGRSRAGAIGPELEAAYAALRVAAPS